VTWALYAEFTALPGAEAEVAALVACLTDRVRAEAGCVIFAPHTLESNPRRWFVYEVYTDEGAFQRHISAPYGAIFNAALAPLIEEEGSQLTWLVPR